MHKLGLILSLKGFRRDIARRQDDQAYENVSDYHRHIRDIVDEGSILPYKIAQHHKFIPIDVIEGLQEVEWEIESREDIYNMISLVNKLVNGRMKLWHLTIPEHLSNVFVDRPFELRRNRIILSHQYIWHRLILNKFSQENGTDGSLKAVADF